MSRSVCVRPFAGVEFGEAPRRSRRPTRPLSRDVVDAGDAVDAVDVDAAEKNSYVRTDCEPRVTKASDGDTPAAAAPASAAPPVGTDNESIL